MQRRCAEGGRLRVDEPTKRPQRDDACHAEHHRDQVSSCPGTIDEDVPHQPHRGTAKVGAKGAMSRRSELRHEW